MLFFVTFAALDGKLVITSVANLPLISIKIVYIVRQFLLSVFICTYIQKAHAYMYDIYIMLITM